ncbi:UDP-N-acetylmuramoylalanine--D-glutamate ligase [Anaerohalosphaera lusitana]|uniref:UDP-N-acetylmuramoylalanine--D-glutamate ligase n=1 Tax=Anaerohalosphaera lusitana TaxID=1936003 RepID=A0A1U9NJC2_9BACT|nr:UDP-N-acetylmuramoyl-L-alanine--D-glutamate ligase [Anaerohalosphaera lusitana]AQT67670.1 UDP-N-acetylmuramoylalanine--D-glutamate ligase [Anaerohalosphaera lusitana]
MDRESLRGKTVVVMGLGRFGGGVDSAVFAAQAGANVIVTDLAPKGALDAAVKRLGEYENISLSLGGHVEREFATADVVIVNPAVDPRNQYVELAKRAGAVVTSQMEIFFQLCPAKIVGITGANGKSTTTALTYHILDKAAGAADKKYRKVWLGGNIGNRPLLGTLGEVAAEDVVVLEISSFQAEQLDRIGAAPWVSLLTNLTPNHLDRHGTFAAYCAAKESLFANQELSEDEPAVSIFCGEDPVAMKLYHKYEGQAGRKCVTFRAKDVHKGVRERFRLAGRMNLTNLAGAMRAAEQFGIGEEAVAKVIGGFEPLAHRLEFVGRVQGVGYYNDSIATTPVSTMAAIDAFDEEKVLIAGGYDKNIPFEELGLKIARKVKAAVLIGQTADSIAEAIKADMKAKTLVRVVDSLKEAVECASRLAERGDVVLMSPACASYDMFDNFQQRGELFKEYVGQLRG